MKRLNIVIISEEENILDAVAANEIANELPTAEQIAMVQSLIEENPEMANDPEVKKLLDLSAKVKDELGVEEEEFETEEELEEEEIEEEIEEEEIEEEEEEIEEEEDDKSKSKVKKGKTGALDELPFFGSKKKDEIDFKKVNEKNLKSFAKQLGVNVSKPGWVGELLKQTATPKEEDGGTYQEKYETLVESINELPKELQTAVNSYIEGKDWKTVIGLGAQLTFEKDFSDMSKEERIKAHNFYFPEDTLDLKADDTEKTTAKALKAAEAKYSSDKMMKANAEKAIIEKRESSNKAFQASVDVSIAQLQKEYPAFDKKELKRTEELIKRTGVHSVFFNKDGSLKPDGAKKLIFALNGEKILKVTQQLAENKGKSKGKAEVLQNEPGVTKKSKGGKPITDIERQTAQYVKESNGQLTY